MMDRDDISDLAIIFGSYFLMMMLGFAFRGQPENLFISQTAVLVLAFALLIIKGEAMKYFAAPYTHLACMIKPKQDWVEFFVKREGQKISFQIKGFLFHIIIITQVNEDGVNGLLCMYVS